MREKMVKTEEKIKLAIHEKITVALLLISAISMGITLSFGLVSLVKHGENYTTSQEYAFKISIPDKYKITQNQGVDGNNYLLYSLNDSDYILEPGKPKLLSREFNIRIPLDAKSIKLSILATESKEIELENHIYPTEKPVVKEVGQETPPVMYVDREFYIDNVFYEKSNHFYPQKSAEIIKVANLRDIKFATVAVYPLRYNPSTKKLRMTNNFQLKITYNSKKDKIPKSLGKTFDQSIGSLELLNGQKLKSLSEPVPLTATTGTVNTPSDLTQPVPTDYLLIAADDLYDYQGSNSIYDFADFRASQEGGGYKVSIAKISNIYNTTFPGSNYQCPAPCENDDKIKIFIKYAYDNWNGANNPPLESVLLVGDGDGASSSLAPTHISSYVDYLGDPIATDYWYSCLDGEQPEDYLSDTYDEISDVYIGRFPVKTNDELNVVVNKTINYPLTTGDWRSQVSLINGHLEDWAADQIDDLIQNIRDNSLMLDHVESLELYRRESSSTADFRTEIISQFNTGRILLKGSAHGSKITWNDSTGTIFHADNIIQNLTNNDYLPVVFSNACQTGWFDDPVFESLGEALLEKKNVNEEAVGAVAGLFSSRTADSVYSNELMENLFTQIINNDKLLLGEATLLAKSGTEITHRLLFNLLGDPTLDFSKSLEESPKTDLYGQINDWVVVEEGNLVFYTRVENSGSSEVTDVLVEMYNGNPSSGTIIDSQNVNIPGKGGTDVNFIITIPPEWQNQIKTFYLVVDGNEQITEIYESNNTSEPKEVAMGTDLPLSRFISIGYDPDIDNNKIVWLKKDGANKTQVYLYDLGENGLYDPLNDPTEGEQQITYFGVFDPNPNNPNIHGNIIVWGSTRGIFAYDLENPQAGAQLIVEGMYPSTDLRINSHKIVWYKYLTDSNNIFLYDLDDPDLGVQQITTDAWDQMFPDIFENIIVWQDRRNDIGDIYYYDLNNPSQGEQPLIIDPHSQAYPRIQDNKVVWEDNRDYTYTREVYLYDLENPEPGGRRITNNSNNQLTPTVSGNRIAWTDWRYGREDIFMYDLKTKGERAIAVAEDKREINPVEYEDKIVYLIDNPYGTDDEIYLVQIPFSLNHAPNLNPVGNQSVNTGQPIKFYVTASDPDNDPLKYNVSYPVDDIFNEAKFYENPKDNGYIFTWLPAPEDIGTYTVNFTVYDGELFDTIKVKITVISSYPFRIMRE